MENENLITNTIEWKDEKINNISKNEITTHYLYGPCEAILYIIASIILFPFFFKFLLLQPFREVIRVNKKKKVLILGDKGMADCCSCCLSHVEQYDLNGVKNVIQNKRSKCF